MILWSINESESESVCVCVCVCVCVDLVGWRVALCPVRGDHRYIVNALCVSCNVSALSQRDIHRLC